MKNNNWAVRIATLDLPKNPMPGTVGAVFPCVFLLVMSYFSNQQISFGFFVPAVCFLVVLPIIQRALHYFNEDDPGVICLDEVVGMLVTLYLIPISLAMVFLGFILFRFFDITKPFGIKKMEKLKGAWGVLLDDVLAGIYANLTLNLILWLY